MTTAVTHNVVFNTCIMILSAKIIGVDTCILKMVYVYNNASHVVILLPIKVIQVIAKCLIMNDIWTDVRMWLTYA